MNNKTAINVFKAYTKLQSRIFDNSLNELLKKKNLPSQLKAEKISIYKQINDT